MRGDRNKNTKSRNRDKVRTETFITRIGDPFVLREGDTYYMYATSSDFGIMVWSGRDLSALKNCGFCYTKEESFGYGCFWAPEVVKRRDGKYIMHFTARDRRDGLLRTGVAESDSPLGPFKDVRAGEPMFDFGAATIDASCFIDEDTGRAYLFFVKDCSTNIINGVHTSVIYGAELDDTLTKLITEPVLIAAPEGEWETRSIAGATEALARAAAEKGEKAEPFMWNEGPSVIKHGGKYYLTYSCNCFDSRDYSVGVAESAAPLGPYKKRRDNPVMKYIDGEISGPGHNSFFTDTDGNIMCAFHIHTDYNKPSGNRRFCYCPVKFEDDGRLVIEYK